MRAPAELGVFRYLRGWVGVGSTRLHDSKQFYPRSEKEVFDLLGLEWIAPEWRNADL